MDNKKITEAIKALPICDDGKSKVADLVKVLCPTYESEEMRTPKAGEIWISKQDRTPYLITHAGVPYSLESGNRGCRSADVTYWLQYKSPTIMDYFSSNRKDV